MTQYTPNRWLAIKFTDGSNNTVKIFASWFGGYLDDESWRLSSGVTSIKVDGDYYVVENHSGSIYRCHKDNEGVTAYSSSILNSLSEKTNMEVIKLDELL